MRDQLQRTKESSIEKHQLSIVEKERENTNLKNTITSLRTKLDDAEFKIQDLKYIQKNDKFLVLLNKIMFNKFWIISS